MLAATTHISRPLAGRYELHREIGRGGNGAVWLGWDRFRSTWVAIKRMCTSEGGVQGARNRFVREARLAAAIRHPNVVAVTDVGAEGDRPFMVMELVEGISIYQWLRTRGPFEPGPALLLLADLLEGVAAIHDAGIVHRDLKPENVMVVKTEQGLVPKLLDFGLAKVIDKSSGHRSAVASRPGFAFGTPHYMAPEQALADPDLDGRCDVYGAGVLLYEMLSGEVPFDAPSSEELLLRLIHEEPVPLSAHRQDLPAAVHELVAKATARRRRDRFPTARAMADAARAVALHDAAPNEPRRPRRSGFWSTAAAAVLGLVATGPLGSSADAAKAPSVALQPVKEAPGSPSARSDDGDGPRLA